MAPVLSLPSAGMRVGPSTLTARAASSTLHSTATSVPVAAPNKKTLLRPGLVQTGAAPSRGRRGGRRVSQAVSPLLSWPDPDAEAGVDALTSSSVAADLPGLWPTIDATSSDAASASAEQHIAQDCGHNEAPEQPTAAAPHEDASEQEEQGQQQDEQLPEPEPLLQQEHHDALAASDAVHAAEVLPAAATRSDALLLHKEPPTPASAIAEPQHHSFQLQPNAAPYSPTSAAQQQHAPYLHHVETAESHESLAHTPHHGYHHHHHHHHHHQAPASQPFTPRQPSYSYAGSTACGSSVASAAFHKDQNSVTIKSDTKVKDAAGAIAKVLDRLCSTLVTALQQPSAPHPHTLEGGGHAPHHAGAPGHFGAGGGSGGGGGGGGQHEALNRAVKALAVCRKYVTDASPPDSGVELGFLPVNRSDAWGRTDASLFSFLAFKSVVQPGYQGTPPAFSSDSSAPSPLDTSTGSPLAAASSSAASASEPLAAGVGVDATLMAAVDLQQQQQQQELHVSSNSDPVTVASHLVRAVLDYGQAVMKAGGGNALFVAMTAVVQARAWLKGWHAMDILLVPQWITEDTRATLGRESKFVQFNVLPSGLHGVLTDGSWQPAIVPMQPPPAAASPSGSSSQLAFA